MPILHAFMKSRRIHHLLPSFSGINTNPEKIRMHINQHETEENINFLNFAFAAKFAGSEQHHRSNVWQFVIFKKYAGFKLATLKPRIHIMLSFRGCWRELWEFKSLLPAKNQTALLKILNFDFRHHHHFVEVIILTCNYTCDYLLKYWDRIVFQQLVKRKKIFQYYVNLFKLIWYWSSCAINLWKTLCILMWNTLCIDSWPDKIFIPGFNKYMMLHIMTWCSYRFSTLH